MRTFSMSLCCKNRAILSNLNCFGVFLTLLFLPHALSAQQTFQVVGSPMYPFQFEEDGQATGIMVEVVRLIFSDLGMPVEVTIREGNLIELAQNAGADALMSVSYVRERESFLIFTDAFRSGVGDFIWASEYYFFVREDKTAAFTHRTLSDLRKRDPVVGSVPGASYSPEFRKLGFRTKSHTNDHDNFQSLLAGTADLVLTDKTIGRLTLRTIPESSRIVMMPSRVFAKNYTLAVVRKPNETGRDSLATLFFQAYQQRKIKGDVKDIFFRFLK